MKTLFYGTCVSFGKDGAVLLRGRSGSGKSDLALRLIDDGASLVSDDQVVLMPKNGALFATAPETIKGLLEVRGAGILKYDAAGAAKIRLVADLSRPGQAARLPDPDTESLAGVTIRRINLDPFEISAPAKLRACLRQEFA